MKIKFDPYFIDLLRDLAGVVTEKITPYDPNREYGVEDLEDISAAMRGVERGIMTLRKIGGREVREFDGGDVYVLFATPLRVDLQTIEQLMRNAVDEGFRGKWKLTGDGFWVELT